MIFLAIITTAFAIFQSVSCAFTFTCNTPNSSNDFVSVTNAFFDNAHEIWKCGEHLKNDADSYRYRSCLSHIRALSLHYDHLAKKFQLSDFSNGENFKAAILGAASSHCDIISDSSWRNMPMHRLVASGGIEFDYNSGADNKTQVENQEAANPIEEYEKNEERKEIQYEVRPDIVNCMIEKEEGQVAFEKSACDIPARIDKLAAEPSPNSVINPSELHDLSKKIETAESNIAKIEQKSKEKKSKKSKIPQNGELDNSNAVEVENIEANQEVATGTGANYYLIGGIGVAVIAIIGVAVYLFVGRGGKEAEPDLGGSVQPDQFNQSQYPQYSQQPGQQYPQYPQQPGQQYPPPQYHPPQYQQPNPHHQQPHYPQYHQPMPFNHSSSKT